MTFQSFRKQYVLIIFLVIHSLLISDVNANTNDKSEIIQRQLYSDLISAESDTVKINVLISMCEYYKFTKLDSLFIYSKQAYDLSKKENYKISKTACILGYAYSNLHDFANSNIYLFEAYKAAEKEDNMEEIFNCLHIIGENYYLMRNDEKALEYLNKALLYSNNFNTEYDISLSLGKVHTALGNYSEAKKYLEDGLELAFKSENQYDTSIISRQKIQNDISVIYNRFGDLYFIQEIDDTSLSYFIKADKLADPENTFISLNNNLCIARGYLATGNFMAGIKIALKVDSIAENEKFLNEQTANCYFLSVLFDTIGESVEAIKYLWKYIHLSEELYDKEIANQAHLLSIKFETSQKELLIENLEKESGFRRLLNIAYATSGILIIVLLLYILRNYKQKNKILALKKEKLSFELFEKDREILMHVMQIGQQKEVLTNVQGEIENILNRCQPEKTYSQVEKLNSEIKTKISLIDDWDQIKLHFEKVHPGFFDSLKEDHPVLTVNELKLCAYSKLKFSIKEISRLLNVNPSSVTVSRYRLKKKMQIPEDLNFDDFIDNREQAVLIS